MYSRIVKGTVKPDRQNEFRDAVNAVLPHIQAQEGFIESIESFDPSTGKFSCVTLWQNAADVEKYDTGLFQEIATGLSPLLQEGPTVETLPVEHSSVHQIRAGSAAA